MELESYYKDHWVEIEEERLERYEKMFVWSSAMAPLLVPAAIAPGQTVGDFGCGPGYLTVELAQQVGPDGHVHAFDINADFIARTGARVAAAGLSDRVTTHLLTDADVPLAENSLDRLVTKNVMVYVDDPLASFKAFHRVTKPGGKVHAIDSDWGMMMIDPVPIEEWRALLDAARYAFRTPLIGRKMYGLARQAGFSKVEVRISATPDTKGRMANFAQNAMGYARLSGEMSEARLQAISDCIDQALADGSFLAVNPQFMVTAEV